MKTQSLKLAYFSPTGTTKSVVQRIVLGIDHKQIDLIDITKPETRKQSLQLSENELLIIGVPVYMGRVPAILNEWFQNLKGQNTLAVCVVVYGNRDFENALLELVDIVQEQGCVPIAGAAFIGEHSFSSPGLPIADNRPDEKDLCQAALLGQRINEKLNSLEGVNQITDINIPGNFPYGGVTELWDMDFIGVSESCTQCGTCAEICPVGAVAPDDSHSIDIEKCITCCACIKNCPQNSRKMKPGLVKDAAKRLNNLYSTRKEPICFY